MNTVHRDKEHHQTHRAHEHTNLARKWRSKNFDEIIGQELCVRMLKNSLYLNQFFPVYLFSGQRGCGKTSSARIFSAAIHCQQLNEFRQHPKTSALPCLTCSSCQAMLAGRHPDFFEIDAASHTGVDHIRTIIDSATLLPIMGDKKIYLIDEAHMLSKASFNALLKILEEPPRSVLFILATTDPHKIIETVKSRCFQLFFKPIHSESLVDHLTTMCIAEHIPYDTQGLTLIAQESEGSVRDAINLLEQVRFSSSSVTKASVLTVLGYIDDAQLIMLFKAVLTSKPADLIAFIKKLNIEAYAAPIIWNRLTELARTALWAKHGVDSAHFVEHAAEIKRIVHRCSWHQLNDLLDQLYAHEAAFLKTTAQHALFEMILLQLSYKYNNGSDSTGSASVPHAAAQPLEEDTIVIDDEESNDDDEHDGQDEEEIIEDDYASQWVQFVSRVETLQDPVLVTLFKQGCVTQVDALTGVITVEFSKDLSFFNDWMLEHQARWIIHLKAIFGENATLQPLFSVVTVNRKGVVGDLRSNGGGPLPTILTSSPRTAGVESTSTFGVQAGGLRSEYVNKTNELNPVRPDPSINSGVNARSGHVNKINELNPVRPELDEGCERSSLTGATVSVNVSPAAQSIQKVVRPAFSKPFYQKSRMPASLGPTIDISDIQKFPQAHMLLRHFPGTITEVRE